MSGQKAELKPRLYLAKGLDYWFELVNNNWFNAKKYKHGRGFTSEYYVGGLGGTLDLKNMPLQEQLEFYIDKGISASLHERSKELAGLTHIINQDCPEDIRPEVLKVLGDDAQIEYWYKHGGRRIEAIPDSLVPKDTSVYEVPPLVQPFYGELQRLTQEGVNQLPEELVEQAKLAGFSCGIQRVPGNILRRIIEIESKVPEPFKGSLISVAKSWRKDDVEYNGAPISDVERQHLERINEETRFINSNFRAYHRDSRNKGKLQELNNAWWNCYKSEWANFVSGSVR